MEYKYDVFISYSSKDYLDDKGKEIPDNVISVIKSLFNQNDITSAQRNRPRYALFQSFLCLVAYYYVSFLAETCICMSRKQTKIQPFRARRLGYCLIT